MKTEDETNKTTTEKKEAPGQAIRTKKDELKEYDRMSSAFYSTPTLPKDNIANEEARNKLAGNLSDRFNEVPRNTRALRPTSIEDRFAPATSPSSKAAGKNAAFIDFAKQHADNYHKDQTKRTHKAINTEIQHRKDILQEFYNPNPPNNENYTLLKNAYGWDDKKAGEYIQQQLTDYDKQGELLKQQLETFHNTEKKTLEEDLQKKIESERTYQINRRHVEAKDPAYFRHYGQEGLEISTDGTKKIPQSEKEFYRIWGVDIKETPTQGGRQFSMTHNIDAGKFWSFSPFSWVGGLFSGALFRKSREEAARNFIVNACMTDPDTKVIKITHGNLEERRDFYLKMRERLITEGKDVSQLGKEGVQVVGYGPSASDIKRLDKFLAVHEETKRKAMEMQLGQKETKAWVYEKEHDAKNDNRGFERWFESDGKHLFESWARQTGKSSPIGSPSKIDANMLNEWWQAKEKGAAQNDSSLAEQKFQDWQINNPTLSH